MANFKIELKEGITTGCLYKTAIIEADSKEEAMKMLLDDGNVGPTIDWDEDYDVEFDASPEYIIKEMK
jgi:3-dehydroquinate synthetase